MSNYTIVFKDSSNYNEMLHDTTGQVVFSYNTNDLRILWFTVNHNIITIEGHIFVFNQLFDQIKKWINRDITKYFNSAFAPHLPHTDPRVVLNIKPQYLNDPTVKLISRFINFKFTIRPKLTLFLPQQQPATTIPRDCDGGDGAAAAGDPENCSREYQFPPLATSEQRRYPYEPERQIPSAPPLVALDQTFVVAEMNNYTDEAIDVFHSAPMSEVDETEIMKPPLKRPYYTTNNNDGADEDDSFEEDGSTSSRSSDEESVLDVDEIQSEVASTLRSSFIGNVKRLKIYNENITAPLRTIAERIIEQFTVPSNADMIIQTAFTTLQNDMVLNLDTDINIPSPTQTPNAFKRFLYETMNNALRIGDEQSIATFIRVLRRVLPMFLADNFHVPFNAVNLL